MILICRCEAEADRAAAAGSNFEKSGSGFIKHLNLDSDLDFFDLSRSGVWITGFSLSDSDSRFGSRSGFWIFSLCDYDYDYILIIDYVLCT